jgi:hypothetical protein
MICEHCGRETEGREHWPQGGYCVVAPLDAPPPKDPNRSCYICGQSMADGHGCLRVYAEAKNRTLVIESRKERGYDLVEWITDGYSGGDVAYFRRPGTTRSGRASNDGEKA